MAEWKTHTISSWNALIRYVDAFNIAKPSALAYVFRGQSDANWSLQHSLARLLPDNITGSDAVNVEDFVTNEFHKQVNLFADTGGVDRRDLPYYWMFMQHHGAATRILDWTSSPFVALYFAVREHPKRDAAIYVLHRGHLAAESLARCGEDYTIIDKREFHRWSQLFRTPWKDMLWSLGITRNFERAAVQQGMFTISSNVLVNHGDAISDILSDSDPGIATHNKLVVPAELKPRFLQCLRQMNITPNSLFPGLDGLCMGLSDLAYIESRPDE